MKIAIFGGSFNPVHNEHVNIVKSAIKNLGLQKVIVIPTNVTPLKDGKLTIATEVRLNLCKLAFGKIAEAEVSDYEIQKGGISYSYLTCQELKNKYPNDELYFIVGADMLANFSLWKNPESILQCVELAVCAREDEQSLINAENIFKACFNQNIKKFSYVGANVSSTKIRTLAALGESLSGYTHEKVANYIKENKLYVLPNLGGVKNYLTPQRWAHSVRVAIKAAENCARIGVSEKTAIIAAALHDCAKYIKPNDPLLKGFTCPDGVPEPVFHQYSSAYMAEKVFGVTDENILNAIRYHTSGRENMTGLEKLIYLCDMLEDGRNYDGVEMLRVLFAEDMDKCLYKAFERQIEYLNKTGQIIYSLTQKAYEYLKENKK